MWKVMLLLSKYKESKDNGIPRIAKCCHFSVEYRVWTGQTPSSGPRNSFDLSVIVYAVYVDIGWLVCGMLVIV